MFIGRIIVLEKCKSTCMLYFSNAGISMDSRKTFSLFVMHGISYINSDLKYINTNEMCTF